MSTPDPVDGRMIEAQPDPTIVANIAFLLGALPRADACTTMRHTLDRLYHGARAKGWGHDAAADYATRFGDAVVAQMHTQPSLGHA
jgi:hypothetical protein